MLWFWYKMLLIVLGLFLLITILSAVSEASKKAAGKRNYQYGENKFQVSVQYRKEQREDGAYLHRVRPKEEADSEDEIPILLDFSCGDEQFFFCETAGEVIASEGMMSTDRSLIRSNSIHFWMWMKRGKRKYC